MSYGEDLRFIWNVVSPINVNDAILNMQKFIDSFSNNSNLNKMDSIEITIDLYKEMLGILPKYQRAIDYLCFSFE